MYDIAVFRSRAETSRCWDRGPLRTVGTKVCSKANMLRSSETTENPGRGSEQPNLRGGFRGRMG